MPQTTPQTDPWVEAAKNFKAQPQGDAPPAENDDWKVWQANDTTPTEQPLLQRAMAGAKDIGIGALKGAGSTANNIGSMFYPHWLEHALTGKDSSADEQKLFSPSNTPQAIGKGVEQAGEFLIPGGAEELGASKLAKFVPQLGKAAEPLAKVVTSGIGSGLVNKAQGGSFGAGAALGVGGSGVAEGLKAAAPSIAESALNIRKLDRAYGKNNGSIGRAILDETKGITPGKVAESAQERLDELNPALNDAANRASLRPNRAKGLLAAPPKEVPLAEPFVRDVKGELIPATPFPRENIVGGTSPRVESELGSTERTIPPRLTRDDLFMTSGSREAADLPTSGPGVWIRPQVIEPGQPPIAKMIANPSASLGGARDVLSNALGTATRQGERTTAGQLEPMAKHLNETIGGETIPESLTPRQLLDLKRGFGNEFIHRWNPETMTGVKGTAARTYHEMGDEFNRAVPEGQELNRRISNLIPVSKRAESAELNAPTGQRVFNRFAAHTGALAGSVGGGYAGYREHGVPGALVGGALGTILPETIASPTGEMLLARTLNSNAPKALAKVFTGAGLTGSRQLRREQ